MTTVLDSLVLELGIDASKFSRGQNEAIDALRKMDEASRRHGTEVESQSKKVLDLLSAVRREALGALAIYFGGREAKEVLDYLTSLDATTGRFARTVAMSTREVSAWQGAFQQIRGTAQSADAALGGLSAEMARFQTTGQSSILPVLSRLGISLYDQNRNLKTAGELWLELADAVKGMDPRQAVAFLQMIPGVNQDMVNFALLGRAAMEQYIRDALQAGVTTEESAKAAQEYQKQLALLDQTATQTGRSLLSMVSGPLIWLLKGIKTVPDTINYVLKNPREAANLIASEPIGEGMGPAISGQDVRAEGIAKLKAAFAAQGGAGGMASNWTNFLSGLSFLETSQTGAPNPGSGAQGYFQFLSGTAARATAAGLPDPRIGSYPQQAAAAAGYIRRFYPGAAAAIDRGDFATAITILRNEWPSLPGGGQPQSAARYATFAQELQGGGPRPPGGGVSIGNINVNVHANRVDADSVGRDVDAALRRSLTAGAANYGPQ